MNHILYASDLSSRSEPAINRAARLAQQHEAELTLLHVIDAALPEPVRNQQKQRAEARLQAARAHLVRRFRIASAAIIRIGKVASVIREVATQTGAGLIVMGTRKRRVVRDALFGTAVERVLGTCGRPVLLVNADSETPYRRVSLALDASAASALAVRFAESLVADADVRSTVMHAYVPPYEGMLEYAGVSERAIMRYALEWKRDTRARIAAMLEEGSADPGRYSITIEGSRAPEGIARAVKRNRPDLLVIGTRGQNWVRRLTLNSVASHLLREVECDVLVVPPGCQWSSVRPRAAA